MNSELNQFRQNLNATPSSINTVNPSIMPLEFDERFMNIISTPMPKPIGMSDFLKSQETGFTKNPLNVNNLFDNVYNDIKKNNKDFNSDLKGVTTVDYDIYEPYTKYDSNYDNRFTAALGQGLKGAAVAGTITANPYVAAGAGLLGALAGGLETSGRQGYIPNADNRKIYADLQSGGFNRIGGFINNTIDRAFEAGVGGTAALLTTPVGAAMGRDFYDWGTNPLSSLLRDGLEQSEYKQKLSDNYLSKGPIAKFFTGEALANDWSDMLGFTLGMMMGVKGQGLINKGAGSLASTMFPSLSESIIAKNGNLIPQLLPTIAKQSKLNFFKGTAAGVDDLAYNSFTKDLAKTITGKQSFSTLSKNLLNSFKDGAKNLQRLSSFEKTTLASYGEARVEAAETYKTTYESAIKEGYSIDEATKRATDAANMTMGGNLVILGITNGFGLNQLMKPNNLASLGKWFTKDWVFDNSRKTLLKNVLLKGITKGGEGIVYEGFAEEFGQYAVSEASKRVALNPNNNPYLMSFLHEFGKAYVEGFKTDEGISNLFGGAMFGALMGMFGMEGITGSLLERSDAKKYNIPNSIKTKLTEFTNAAQTLANHTTPFNGQFITSYSQKTNPDGSIEYVEDPNGEYKSVSNSTRLLQLIKALSVITQVTNDQALALLNPTSEEFKNLPENIKTKLFPLIEDFLNYGDENLKEESVKSLTDFIEDKNLSQYDRNLIITALSNIDQKQEQYYKEDPITQLLIELTKSNYVFDHISNGLEDILFDNIDQLEKLDNEKDKLEFFGRLYKPTEIEQYKQDVAEFKKTITNQIDIYKKVYNRYGSPLTYIKLATKNDKGETSYNIHPVTVDLNKVFRSTLAIEHYDKSIKQLDEKILELEDELIAENTELREAYLNPEKTSEDVKNSKEFQQLETSIAPFKAIKSILEERKKQEEKLYKKLTDTKEIIKEINKSVKIHNDFVSNPPKDEEIDNEIKENEKRESIITTPTPAAATPAAATPAAATPSAATPSETETNDGAPDAGGVEETPALKIEITGEEELPVDNKIVEIDVDDVSTLDGFVNPVEMSESEEDSSDSGEVKEREKSPAKPVFSEFTLRKTYGNAYDDDSDPNSKTPLYPFYEYMSNIYDGSQDIKMLALRIDDPLVRAIINSNPSSKDWYDKHPSAFNVEGQLFYILTNNEGSFLKSNGKPIYNDNNEVININNILNNINYISDIVYVKNSFPKTDKHSNEYGKTINQFIEQFSKVDEFDGNVEEAINDYIEDQKFIFNKSSSERIYLKPLSHIKGVNINAKLKESSKIPADKQSTLNFSYTKSGKIFVKIGANSHEVKTNRLTEAFAKELFYDLIELYEDKKLIFTLLNANKNTVENTIGRVIGSINYIAAPTSPNINHSNGFYRHVVINELQEAVAVEYYYGKVEDKLKIKEAFEKGEIPSIPENAGPIYSIDLTKYYKEPNEQGVVVIDLKALTNDHINKFAKAVSEKVYFNINKLFTDTNKQISIYKKEPISYTQWLIDNNAFSYKGSSEEYLERTNKQLILSHYIDVNKQEPSVEKAEDVVIEDTTAEDSVIETTIQEEEVQEAQQVQEEIQEIQETPEVQEKDEEELGTFGVEEDEAPFRLIIENHLDEEELENFQQFQNWLSEVLPQFKVRIEDDAINGIAQGQLLKDVIRLWKLAKQGTGFHEAFEAVFNNILTPQEQTLIINEFRNQKGTFEYYSDGRIIKYSEASFNEAKEMLAEGFIEFMKTKKLQPNKPVRNNIFLRLLQWLNNFISSLVSKYKTVDNAEKEINKIYSKLALGEYANFKIKEYNNIPQNRDIIKKISGNDKGKIVNEFEIQMIIGRVRDLVFNDFFKNRSYNPYEFIDMYKNKSLQKDFNDSVNKYLDAAIADYNRFYSDVAASQGVDYVENIGFDLMDENNKFDMKYREPIKKIFIEEFRKSTNIDKFDDFEDLDENEKDPLGLKPTTEINPTSNVNNVVRFLLSTLYNKDINGKNLIDDEFFKKSFRVQSKANLKEVLYVLINTLAGIEDGAETGDNKGKDVLIKKARFNEMMGKLNMLDSNKYRWVRDLQEKLKYGQENLTEYDVRLQIAFANSFYNYTYEPKTLMYTSDLGVIYVNEIFEQNQNDLLKKFAEGFRELGAKKENNNIYLEEETNLPYFDFNEFENEYKGKPKLSLLKYFGVTKVEDYVNFINYKQEQAILRAIDDIHSALRNKFHAQELRNITPDYKVYFGTINKEAKSKIELIARILGNARVESLRTFKNAKGTMQQSVILNSYTSRLINTLNQVKTQDEFFHLFPEYNTPGFTQHKLIKKNGYYFDSEGKRRSLGDGVLSNIKFNLSAGGLNKLTESGVDYSNLTKSNKAVIKLVHALYNSYNVSINSDKGMELFLQVDPHYHNNDVSGIVKYNGKEILGVYEKTVDRYIQQLYDEIHFTVSASEEELQDVDLAELGFYKDIIGFTKEDYNYLKSNPNEIKNFVLKQEIRDKIVKHIYDYTESAYKRMKDEKIFKHMILEKNNERVIDLNQLPFLPFRYEQYEEIDGKKYIVDFAFKKIINNALVNIELFDRDIFYLLYANPVLFKKGEIAKRASAAHSSKMGIVTHSKYLKETDKHYPRMDGAKRGEYVSFLTYIDPVVQSDSLTAIAESWYESYKLDGFEHNDIIKNLGVQFTEDGKYIINQQVPKSSPLYAYTQLEEADGGALIMLDGWFDTMYLSSKLTSDQIALIEYEKAFERLDRSSYSKNSPFYYKYTDKELRKKDEEIVKKGIPANTAMQVLKTHGYGLIKGKNVAIGKLLKHSTFPLTWRRVKNNDYLKNKYIQWQNNKIDIITFKSGQKLGRTGKTNQIYEDVIPSIQQMKRDDFRIQVEMSPEFKKEVNVGVQATTIVLSNLGEYIDPTNKLFNPTIKELVDDYIENLREMINKGENQLLDKLGLIKNKDGSYETGNLEKLIKTLKQEAFDRDLPINVTALFEIDPVTRTLPYKFDSSSEKKKIEYILNSILDKSFIHYKRKGTMSPQVFSSFERKTMNYVYLKNGVWTKTNSLEKLTEEEKATVKLSSSDLKIKKDGTIQVKMPSYLKGIVGTTGKIDPRLLKIIGFRIPTQSLGQLEKIEVVEFLDETYGECIIVPSEIVGKAGSDFDIDKLTLYIAHSIKNEETGEYEYLEYLTDDNSTVEERYENYIYDEFFKIVKQEREYIKEALNEYRDELGLNESYESLKEREKEYEDYVLSSYNPFYDIPISIQKSFMLLNDQFNLNNIKGIEKQSNFLLNLNSLIDSVEQLNDSEIITHEYLDKKTNKIVEENITRKDLNNLYKLADYYKKGIEILTGNESKDFFKKLEEYNEYKKDTVKTREEMLNFLINVHNAFTLEEFTKLPLVKQNRREAIENRNIELMWDLMSLPQNRFQHTLPNSSSTLKEIANELLDKDNKKEKSFEINTFFGYVDKRHNLIYAKNLVGSGALNITSHPLSQIAKVMYEEGVLLSKPTDDGGTSKSNPFYYKYDENGNLISATLSEYLSAFVDATKDEYIIDVNINFETVTVAMLLGRMGIPAQKVIYFLNRESIKNIIYNYQLSSGLFTEESRQSINSLGIEQIRKILSTDYAIKNFKKELGRKLEGIEDIPKTFVDDLFNSLNDDKVFSQFYEDLDKALNILIYSKATKKQAIKIENIKADNPKKENYNSLLDAMYVYEFMNLYRGASELRKILTNFNLSSTKTKTISENQVLIEGILSMLQKEQVYPETTSFSNVGKLLSETYLGEIFNKRYMFTNFLKPYMKLAEKEMTSYTINAIRRINNANVNNTKKSELIDKFNTFMLSYLVQKNIINSNPNVYNLLAKFDENNNLNNTLAKQMTNIKRILKENNYKGILFSQYNKVLLRNVLKIIDSFILIVNDQYSIYDNITPFTLSNDTNKINEIILLFENVMDRLSKTTKKNQLHEFFKEIESTFKNIVDFSLLQSGIQVSRYYINTITPVTPYLTKVNNAFNTETLPDFDIIWEYFIQNNLYNKTLVPVKKLKYVEQTFIEELLTAAFILPETIKDKYVRYVPTKSQQQIEDMYDDYDYYNEEGYEEDFGSNPKEIFLKRISFKDQIYYIPITKLGDGSRFLDATDINNVTYVLPVSSETTDGDFVDIVNDSITNTEQLQLTAPTPKTETQTQIDDVLENVYLYSNNITQSKNVIIDNIAGRKPAGESNIQNKNIKFEEEQTSGYRNRTIKNASADATIAIAVDFNSAGEKLTKSSVLSQGKKYIPRNANEMFTFVDPFDKSKGYELHDSNIFSMAESIVADLNSVKAKTLNIAGNGIYTMKGKYSQQLLDEAVERLLEYIIYSDNLENEITSIRTGGQTGFDEAGTKAGIKLGLPTLTLAPKGWTFRNINGQDISNEQQFKARFNNLNQSSKPIVAYRTQGNNFLKALQEDNAIGNPWSHLGSGQKTDLKTFTNYSGAAQGGDTIWENVGKEFGLGKQVNYRPEDLQKLTKEQLQEVEIAYQQSVKDLGRKPLAANTFAGGLVRRDYLQAKAADAVFAISTIVQPNEKDPKGYINKTNNPLVAGGTGYAVQMAINLGKPVYVFDQIKNKWFVWNKNTFTETTTPILTTKFAGIGTREINDNGKQAIRDVYEKSTTQDSKNEYGLYKTNTVKEAVEEFISWMIGEKHTDILQDYRQAIIDKIPEMKGKTILYYKDLGRPSHATALDYLINEYNWNNIANDSVTAPSDRNISLEIQNITDLGSLLNLYNSLTELEKIKYQKDFTLQKIYINFDSYKDQLSQIDINTKEDLFNHPNKEQIIEKICNTSKVK